MKCVPSSLGRACICTFAASDPAFFFRQRESRQLFAVNQRRQPFRFLLARSEKEQCTDADGMMRIRKNRSGSATSADFLQHFAIRHLRKSASAKFLWRGHAENADVPEAIDEMTRNIGVAINRNRIEIFVEELADFRERLIQLGLLRCRKARIRHRPIGNEFPEEQSFGEAKFLASGEKEFFCLLDFLLPLDFCFVHELHR